VRADARLAEGHDTAHRHLVRSGRAQCSGRTSTHSGARRTMNLTAFAVESSTIFIASGAVCVIAALVIVALRSMSTLKAVAFVPGFSRRLSRWVHPNHYEGAALFTADGAGDPWVDRRQEGLDRLAGRLRAQYGQSSAWGTVLRESFSDLRFTDA